MLHGTRALLRLLVVLLLLRWVVFGLRLLVLYGLHGTGVGFGVNLYGTCRFLFGVLRWDLLCRGLLLLLRLGLRLRLLNGCGLVFGLM